MPRGGIRPHAGRRGRNPIGATQMITVRVNPETVANLAMLMQHFNGDRSETIRTAIEALFDIVHGR